MKYVIIGNGPAGSTAAREIRKNDNEGSITIISKEKIPFYYRPRLPEVISGKASEQDIIIIKDEWYKENKIDLKLKQEVAAIIVDEKKIILKDGESIDYDKLLIATGSIANKIPIPGIDGEHIFTLRTIDDALILNSIAKHKNNIGVIGGGLLGLEAAYSLAAVRKSTVTVIEYFDRLLPRQLDKEGADILQLILEKKGLNFMLGAATTNISNKGDKNIIEIKDGRVVEVDFLLVSTGIKIEKALAEKSGITSNKGIITNNRMETNKHDIYAAGDCAEHNGRIYGLWPAAMEQGGIAGKVMAGKEGIYNGTIPSTELKVAGINLVSMGEILSEIPSNEEEKIEYKKINKSSGIYKNMFVQNGIIKGAILIGDIMDKNKIQKAIGKSEENIKVLI